MGENRQGGERGSASGAAITHGLSLLKAQQEAVTGDVGAQQLHVSHAIDCLQPTYKLSPSCPYTHTCRCAGRSPAGERFSSSRHQGCAWHG